MTPEDEIWLTDLAKQADEEQRAEGSRHLCRWLLTHFGYLVEAGWTESQAIWLVAQLQNAMLLTPRAEPKEGK